MSRTVYRALPSLTFSGLLKFSRQRILSNNLQPLFLHALSTAISPSLFNVSVMPGETSILSGIVMLFSLAASRMIFSASATRPLAYSHTADSGSSLHISNKRQGCCRTNLFLRQPQHYLTTSSKVLAATTATNMYLLRFSLKPESVFSRTQKCCLWSLNFF